NPGPSWHAIGTGDFNGDHRSDILFQNDSGEVSVGERKGKSVLAPGTVGSPGPSWNAVSTGVFNNDGFSDLLIQNDNGEVAVWHVTGDSSPYLPGNIDLPWQSDGASVFLQNDSGQAFLWVVSGTTIAGGGTPGNPGPSWHERAIGDFNGDRNPDILFQNDSGE